MTTLHQYPSFTYNGERRPYVAVLERGRPYRAPRRHNLLAVPGRPGAYITDTTQEVLRITCKVIMEAESPAEQRRMGEDFAKWVGGNEPAALVFDDEPNRTYFAVVDGALDPEEFVNFGFLEFEWLCPDGFKHGPEHAVPFSNAYMTIQNQGNEETPPRFVANVKGSITNLDIVTEQGYMRVGAPAPIDRPVVDPQTLVLSDELATMNGWSVANQVDNGHVTGSMTSDGNGFLAATWGAIQQPEGFQGPSVIRGLSTPVQDFMAEIDVEQLNDIETAGMIEVYFRDAGGNVVAKLGIEDRWQNAKLNRVKFQVGPIGNRVDFNRTADNPWNWDDFKGVLRIQRKGRSFHAYFAKKDSRGNHHTRANISYTDTGNQYQAPIASIQLAIRKWPHSHVPQTDMKITKVQVWRLNTVQQVDPVIIAKNGDVIEIDHSTGAILVNGEPRVWLKDFGSSFFKLKKGQNAIHYSPRELVDLTLHYRERY